MKNKIVSLLLSLSILGGITGIAVASTATFRVVQTPTIHLYAGLSGTGTSARVTPYPKDLDGNKLVMSDFGATPTFTVDPKVTNYEEIISFTGMTDNGDNTATLTGLSRDLTSKYPYTTTGTGRTHSAGAIVVFSNNPQIYGRLGALENDQTFTGLNTFTLPPYSVTPTTTNQVATKGYADGLVIAGGVNASESTQGLVQLPTNAQVAASTKTGSSGARLGLNTLNATSSPFDSGVNVIPVTGSTGKLSPRFIATSSADVGTTGMFWTASTTFSGATTTLAATTTIAAATTTPLILNGVPESFPATQGVASSTLTNDGLGNLFWATPEWRLIASTTLTSAVSSTTLRIATTSGTSLHIVIFIPSGSAISNAAIQFNGDLGNNYGSRFTENGVNNVFDSKNVVPLMDNFIQTAGAAQAVFDITNIGNRPKVGTFQAAVSNGGNSSIGYQFGAFIWGNTSNPINQITLGAGSNNLNIGTQIAVYASAQ